MRSGFYLRTKNIMEEKTFEEALRFVDEAIEKLENTPMFFEDCVKLYADAGKDLELCIKKLKYGKTVFTDIETELDKESEDLDIEAFEGQQTT